MNKVKHPSDRLSRRLAREKKLINEQKKKAKEERADRVWRKLHKEFTKEQETENELRRYKNVDHIDLNVEP